MAVPVGVMCGTDLTYDPTGTVCAVCAEGWGRLFGQVLLVLAPFREIKCNNAQSPYTLYRACVVASFDRGVASRAIGLRACYATPGSDIAYGAASVRGVRQRRGGGP
eukprot:2789766-Rhodomonas_salina.6